MPANIFPSLYDKLKVPVIICRRDVALSVAYLNTAARLLFAPNQTVEAIRGNSSLGVFADLCRFASPGKLHLLLGTVRETGEVGNFDATILSFQDDPIQLRVQANAVNLAENEFYVFYLGDPPEQPSNETNARFMAQVLNASHCVADPCTAIRNILELTGEYAKVSRAFIFEDINATTTRNTYEWCAPGVVSTKEHLQNLNKADYNYDAIMNSSGMLITSDTGSLPEKDRDILEKQGIKSIAILPMFHNEEPLGYIGFDDCEKCREWSMEEIQLLKNVASVTAPLISRRIAERQSRRGQEILRTVADNLDELVYISDLDTYALKFVSRSLVRAMNKSPREILGKACWSVLHRGQSGPCPFCPLPRIRDNVPGDASYIWELHNSISGKWYMVKDAIIDWIDGTRAHLSTLVDITYRKQYEEQLKHFAATDAMTDVYNRKWGYGKLEKQFTFSSAVRARQTLCFIDVDGLKKVNDSHGHAAGDEMIMNIVRTIFSCIRKDDFISRWGGDEFIVFLNCGIDDARGVMSKIHFGMEHFNSTRDKPYRLSISEGFVDFSEPYATLDDLIAEADRRMYANKMKKQDNNLAFGIEAREKA